MARYRGVEHDDAPRCDPAYVACGNTSPDGAHGSSRYPMAMGYGGEGLEPQAYEVSQTAGVPGYLEPQDTYCEETAQPAAEGDEVTSQVTEQVPSASMMYDYGAEYSTAQPMAVPGYEMGLVDSYDQSGGSKQMTPGISSSMSGGLHGSMYANMPSTEESIDTMNAQYWYGRNSMEQAMVPPSCDLTMYQKPMTPRYDGYRFPFPPYYPQNGQSYATYGSERNLPYSGSYGMHEEGYSPAKQHYSPRRAVSTGALPAPCKTPPINCYQMSPDHMAMRGWSAQGYPEGVDQNAMQNIPMINQSPMEQQPMQMPPRFGPDAFYGELTRRLQQEMKSKKQAASGRPKVSRHNYVCAMCHARTTPQWRYIKGTSVCNACYMRIRKQKLRQRAREKEEAAMKFESASAETEIPDDRRLMYSVGAPHR
ncbi:hypothetical protein, conserved [Babesia bigemina]|uniref:GATA-type domain-containing protein n=1 Tax=Babesia bigemina TaxID=5866 RepID=A0A061D870_BABBI|nr:hypothetical protein, conserved [Babesia bigemina]CDR96728.1 hypothetical protein, conserved [Babesia bigemina]|eukprot:XP_012768914.1 hypothetical protein, conserved [Babesia bigemina]